MYSLGNLAKKLKKILKKYKGIHDFIIFGSIVKNKMDPKDIDIAMIVSKTDTSLVGKVKQDLDKIIKNSHLQIINYNDLITSKLPYHILSEGYSVKIGKFISNRLNVKKKVLFSFNLENLKQSQKVMFNKALKNLVHTSKSKKVGKGAVLVDIKQSGEFEDLFNLWKRKINKNEFLEI